MKTTYYPYQDRSVRVATDDGDGTYWFVAKDVADLLGYRTAEVMTRKLRNIGVASGVVDGVNRSVLLLDKAALLRCVFGSQKVPPQKLMGWFLEVLIPEVEGSHTRQARISAAERARPRVGSGVEAADIEFNPSTQGRFFTADQFAACLGVRAYRIPELENQMRVAHRALVTSEGPFPVSAEVEGKVYYEIEFLRVLKAGLAFSPRRLAEGHSRAINHLIRRGRLGVADAVGEQELKGFLTGEAED